MNYLYDYKTFHNANQLNKTVYAHIRKNTYMLNETDRTALKMISRYAVKYEGVAHLKASTIADLIGKSVKTARRVIDKLRDLGIIDKVATTRKISGGKGANIIVILPVEKECTEDTTPCTQNVDTSTCTQNVNNDVIVQSTMTSREDSENIDYVNAEECKNEKEPSDSIKQLQSTNNSDTRSPVPASALRSAMPHAIYTAMSPFFNADDLYKYYGLLLQAKRKICPSTLIEHCSEPYVEAIYHVILKYKQGTVRNLDNYMFKSFLNAADVANVTLNEDKESDSSFNLFKDVFSNVV